MQVSFFINWVGGVSLSIRYLHFQVVPTTTHIRGPAVKDHISRMIADKLVPNHDGYIPPGVAQWVNCDIRSFDYSVLGQYVTSPLAVHMS